MAESDPGDDIESLLSSDFPAETEGELSEVGLGGGWDTALAQQDGDLFENFRYQFGFPDRSAPDVIPLAFQRLRIRTMLTPCVMWRASIHHASIENHSILVRYSPC